MGNGDLKRLFFRMHERFQKRKYDSWLVLKEEELENLRDKTFAMIGFGGVGTITVELLARWGVRNFRLLDMDRYSETNKVRQLFAINETVGRLKAKVAAERIRAVNPSANIEMVVCERVTRENAEQLIKGADMVIQTADTPSALILYQTARKYKVPLINGYCANHRCLVQVYDYKNRKCKTWVESLKERIKWKGRKHINEMNDQEMDALDTSQYDYEQVCPPLNFVTNTAGCLMISEAVKLITGRGVIAHYPKRINLDLLNLKLKVDNAYSLFKLENYMRLFTLLKGRMHLAMLQKKTEPKSDPDPSPVQEEKKESAKSPTHTR
ncbi:MAG: ThiF family adenylyltransferase [Planctomycetota bacterium]|jgi:tRNA A37 threonylcarbamoyladenosine dehydratase